MPLKTAPSAPRLYFLDAARGILMLLGIVVHTSNIYTKKGLWEIADTHRSVAFDVISQLIHVFRMPAFFWISGYFCAMTFLKLGTSKTLGQRIPRLIVPLLVTWGTLNVIQEYGLAVYRGVNPIEAVLDGVDISHLWFLVDLTVFTVLGVAALHTRLLQRLPVPDFIADNRLLQMLALVVISQACKAAIRLSGLAYISPLDLTTPYRLATYGPFFAVGMLMYLRPQLCRSFLSMPAAWLFIAVPLGAGAANLPKQGSALDEMVHGFGCLMAWVSVAATLSAFHRAFKAASAVTRFLSEASYSIYLFHHIVVISMGIALMNWPMPIAVKFVVICAVTMAGTGLLHVHVIQRFALLRFLFNGKR